MRVKSACSQMQRPIQIGLGLPGFSEGTLIVRIPAGFESTACSTRNGSSVATFRIPDACPNPVSTTPRFLGFRVGISPRRRLAVASVVTLVPKCCVTVSQTVHVSETPTS